MNNCFKIYIDRLKAGYQEKIDVEVGPDFLNICDEDLSFPGNMIIKGETYLAEDQLIIHLKIETPAVLPCLVCNEPVTLPLKVSNFYHVEPTEEIKEGFFDFSEQLREAILLEAPSFVECNEGKCPKRDSIDKFLKRPSESAFPFSDLDK